MTRMRFADRLNVEIAIAPSVSDALVPSLLLQPLVENAISHGISSRISGGSIRITAARKGDAVEIDIWTME